MPSENLNFQDYKKSLYEVSDGVLVFGDRNDSDRATITCQDGEKISIEEEKLDHVIVLNGIFQRKSNIYIEDCLDDALLFFCFLYSSQEEYKKYKTEFHKDGILIRICQKWEYMPPVNNVSLILDSKDIANINNKGLFDTFCLLSDGIEDEFNSSAFSIANNINNISNEGNDEHDCDDEKCEHHQAMQKIINSIHPGTERSYFDAIFCATNRHLIKDFFEMFDTEYDDD